jgi:hypothetical protein
MRTQVWKKAIINTLAADGGNVGYTAATGGFPAMMYICSNDISNNAGSPFTVVGTPSEILPPIPAKSVLSISKIASAAEVTQILMLGVDTEVIVA